MRRGSHNVMTIRHLFHGHWLYENHTTENGKIWHGQKYPRIASIVMDRIDRHDLNFNLSPTSKISPEIIFRIPPAGRIYRIPPPKLCFLNPAGQPNFFARKLPANRNLKFYWRIDDENVWLFSDFSVALPHFVLSGNYVRPGIPSCIVFSPKVHWQLKLRLIWG